MVANVMILVCSLCNCSEPPPTPFIFSFSCQNTLSETEIWSDQSLHRALLWKPGWTPPHGVPIMRSSASLTPSARPLPLTCFIRVDPSRFLGDSPRVCTVCLPHPLDNVQFLLLYWEQLRVTSRKSLCTSSPTCVWDSFSLPPLEAWAYFCDGLCHILLLFSTLEYPQCLLQWFNPNCMTESPRKSDLFGQWWARCVERFWHHRALD